MQENNVRTSPEWQIFLSSLGERLRSVREKTGLSQAALGERFDMSDRTISRYEQGKAVPSLEYVWALAELTEMSAEELVFGKEKPAPQEGKRAVTTFEEIEASVQEEDRPTVKTEEFAGWTMLVAGREQLTFDIVVRGRGDRAVVGEILPREL